MDNDIILFDEIVENFLNPFRMIHQVKFAVKVMVFALFIYKF